MLTPQRLKEVLSYDPGEGVFRWRIAPSIRVRGKIGQPAGSPDRHGYPLIRLDGVRYSAHRLAWYWVHGEWPNHELDHINRDRADYRIANLRPASRSQNSANIAAPSHNTSGVKGVVWDRVNGKWMAQIHHMGRCIKIGRYSDKEQAASAYLNKARELFGEFACAA